jgi:DNA-binding NarL/FixJ family response regulator
LKNDKEIITIVLAISSGKVRQGIQLLLKMEPDISVVGEATNGIEAMSIVQMLHPDVLIMELMIGQMKDAELIKQTAKLSPVTGVVVFSLYNAPSYIKEVFQAGAKAYVLKESTPDELIYAIHQVVEGHRFVSKSIEGAGNSE